MKIPAAYLLFLATAACAENSAPVADDTTTQDTAPVVSYAPREANGLPGHAAIAEVIGKKCPGRVPEIRQVTCQGFDEEPTEFSCNFEFRQEDGSWAREAMTIAIDGRYGWLDIGGPECDISAMTVSE